MDKARLNEIIEKHKRWLNGEKDGVRADLSHSDLRYSDLSHSDLSHSDLRYSDLRYSDLSYSDLSYSDMRHSNLSDSNMSHSDLRYSDLSHSNLLGSNMRGSDISGSDMSHSDLRYSDLSHSNLRGSNLRGSDISGSDIDYACWPLWCGSLDVHIDDRIARQLLYHLMRPCLVSPDVSVDFKRALFTPELIAEANKFHRAKKCGLIENPYEEDDHRQSNEEDAGHD